MYPRQAFHGSRLLGWGAGAVTVAVVAPIACLLFLAAFPEENIWAHLIATVLPRYVQTTLVLMIGVGLGSLALGISTAWLVTMCQFPGRGVFRWALVLPLSMPAYLVAYIYTDLLEFTGPVQRTVRVLGGWQRAQDYWFPEVRSIGGAVVMLTLVLYPYVYMLARNAFANQSVNALEASRLLGASLLGAFYRVVLPSARPAIMVGLSLVLMETVNDFGTVDYFGVQTLSAGVYDTWLTMGNLGGAAQIALVLLLFVTALIGLERFSRHRQGQHTIRSNKQPLPQFKLTGLGQFSAFALCAFCLGLGFIIPTSTLIHYIVTDPYTNWNVELLEFVWNSVWLAVGAALITVSLGVLIAYSVRLRTGKWTRIAVRIASLGYAIPGAVLAIGVLVLFANLDNTVDTLMRNTFGISTGLLLSGTGFAILFAYVVRFLTIPIGGMETNLQRITPSMDMVARTLGDGPGRVFWRVHLPLIRGGMLATATLVFVDCMKELPATLMLRPFNFDTLTTYLYQFASDEQIETAALGGLIIIVVGLAPVIVLNRSLEKSERSD